VRYSDDDWVPEAVIIRNAKKGPALAKIGLQIPIRVGWLEARENKEKGTMEYHITEKGRNLRRSMSWKILKE
jgi:hypothetical protein